MKCDFKARQLSDDEIKILSIARKSIGDKLHGDDREKVTVQLSDEFVKDLFNTKDEYEFRSKVIKKLNDVVNKIEQRELREFFTAIYEGVDNK